MTDQTTVPGTPDTTVPPPANAQIPDQQVPAFDGPEWLARFPDDVKTDRSLWKYSNDESAVRGLINAQRLIGADKVAKPKGDFDPANPDWGAFLEAAGRPKSADEYKFGEAKLPDGMSYDSGLEDKFKPVAHALGLNARQAQGLRDFLIAHNVEAYQSATKEGEADTTARREALRQELGSAYDSWVKASEVAQSEFMSDALLAKINAAGLTRDPEWIRALGKIGKSIIGEEKLKTQGVGSEKTPAQWQAAANDFRAANADALFNSAHPLHQQKARELQVMMEMGFPS